MPTERGVTIKKVRMNRGSRILLVGGWALVGLTLGVAVVVDSWLPSLYAVVSLLCIYWISCWVVFFFGAPEGSLVSLFRPATHTRHGETILAWMPAAAVGCIVFLPTVSSLFPLAVAGAAVAAVANSVTEEALWRGAFVMRFPRHLGLGLLFPLVPFASWHVALAQIPIEYGPGGHVGLVGGAAGLGLIWGWVAWRTRNLRSVTLAHAMTNFFGFSAVAASNWPSP